LSALREKIYSTLEAVDEDIFLAAYSLSCRPTIDAVMSLSDSIKAKIQKIIFIHPARNPLYSVQIMDWLLSDNEKPLSEEHYLHGDTSKVFNALI
jgi:hypothetical protein